MTLCLSFEPTLERGKESRVVFKVGEALVRSYPMTPDDHYRDLLAIEYFLQNRQLSNLFLGDEPKADVAFLEGGVGVILSPYPRLREKALSGSFNREQGLEQLREVLARLKKYVSASPEALQNQVESDIEAGVFDTYLRR